MVFTGAGLSASSGSTNRDRQESSGYQGQGRGSGVTSDRPSPGGGNTGGSDKGGGRDRQDAPSKGQTVNTGGGGGTDGGKAARDAADDARAKATQDAVDRERQKASDAARESQARVDAAAAETAAREAQKRQMAEAEKARLDSVARQEAARIIGIPSLVINEFSRTPMSMPLGLTPTIPGGMMADQKNLFNFGYTDPTSTAMRMQGDTERNLSNLRTLDPSFQTKIAGTLDDVMNSGQNPYLVSTARTFTPAQLPGGAKPAEDSYHKYGLAADIGLTGGTAQDYADMGAIGYDRGLGWGGSFSSNYDPEHLQAGPVGVGATEYATAMDVPKVSVSGQPFLPSGSPGVGDQIAASDFVKNFNKNLNKTFDTIGAGVKTVADATGVSSVADFLTNKSLRDEIVRNNNRDRQMTSEEVNIAMFNRLHPEAGSNRERYGGRDQVVPPMQAATATTPPAVVPPVVPTEPVMPTVPNFAAAQQYIGTPTVATPGFNFSMPFAPRPQVDFANLGQAYAPTALASAPPQPLPGIPGAAYATPYQRLG